ncbi:MAG: iron-containing alcohol dehydrogenase [Fibrobacteraceae bacterium]|nr:iron-containing alcohol dehydrogenase [Fibrobacteraceae bacterium]
MIPFTYYSPTRFIFGNGSVCKVGQQAKAYGATNVLVVYGSFHAERSGLLKKVVDSLALEGIKVLTLGGVKANPVDSLVYKGVQVCKENHIDFILALGGGSVIDTAKGIAMGALDDGELWDFYSRKRMPQKALPVAVVLTIPAAGSEGSGNSVLTQESTLLKRSATGECIRPRFSILDPELTFSLPLYQTACGIVDMMAHIFERYFTKVTSVDLTDEMCEGVLRSIIKAGSTIRDYWNNPNSVEMKEARASLMWAGTVAHVDILGVGREGDWSVHALEHEMSALYDVAHGAGLAITYPHWMRYQMKFKQERFDQLAERVFGVKDGMEGIQKLSDFWTSLGMPTRLSQIPGFKESDIFVMAKKAKRNRPGELGNFHPLNDDQVVEVYRSMI